MNPYPDHPCPCVTSRGIRWPVAASGRDFVCILDVGRKRQRTRSFVADGFTGRLSLLALVVFLAGAWDSTRPAQPLHIDSDAIQLAKWESPTAFLLDSDFPSTQPD
jgi:hypothetical protein